ncbi:MAG: hypothetical protein JXB49_08265 [Bacteroidales bacterium]|nr:hypothetical protein [Bacteroidales bacterium]
MSSRRNPLSSGNTIEIHGIKNGDEWINLKRLHLSGNYEIDEESVFLFPSSSGNNWRIKAVGELIINFRSRPDAGVVEIISEEFKRKIDLYSAVIEEIPLSLEFPMPQSIVLFSLLLYSYSFGYTAFFIPALILAPYLSKLDASLKTTGHQHEKEKELFPQILTNLLVPMFILAMYCSSITLINYLFLIKGVTYFFVNKLWLYGTIFIIVIYLIVHVIYKFRNIGGRQSSLSIEKLEARDFILLLLPLTPIAQYVINNQSYLTLLDSLFVVAFFILFSGIYIFVIPAVFNKISSKRNNMIFGLALMYAITNMAYLSRSYSWFEYGDFWIQIIYFSFILITAYLMFNKKNKKNFYAFIVLFFFTNTSLQLISQWKDVDTAAPVHENRLFAMAEESTPVVKPNIYLLVYDAYVINETMLEYGIDNSEQEVYLREQGFVLYPHTYSVGSSTIRTMGNVLNISTNDQEIIYAKQGISGDGIVQKILKSLGYETYGVFPYDYMFIGIGSSYDFSIPENVTHPYDLFIRPVLIGEFRSDMSYKEITRDQYLEAKHTVFSNHKNPFFIYTHSSLPYHSQNSGACRIDEIKLFNDRLLLANIEMQQDIDMIIKKDPKAIIIIAGDHGPYLTKNCTSTKGDYDLSEITRLDIQDRYGCFLAIKWPTDDYQDYDEITVLQDLFPAIFAYMYKDGRFLELKIDPSIRSIASRISGALVNDGIISGGVDDGEPLFISEINY